jgi:hypothetical protein
MLSFQLLFHLPLQEAKALQAAEEHRRKEIERRMHPRTAADFEILYNELEAWRLQVGVVCEAQGNAYAYTCCRQCLGGEQHLRSPDIC